MSKAPCSICGRRDLTDPCADCQPLTDLQKIAVRNVRMAAHDVAQATKRLDICMREARQAKVIVNAWSVYQRILGKVDAA